MIAMRFLNASVLESRALNRNLSWGFPLGNLLPKTRVLKHRVLERKRRPNANASVLGTQRFRTLSFCHSFRHGFMPTPFAGLLLTSFRAPERKKGFSVFSCGATPVLPYLYEKRVDLRCQKEGILGKKNSLFLAPWGGTGQKKQRKKKDAPKKGGPFVAG